MTENKTIIIPENFISSPKKKFIAFFFLVLLVVIPISGYLYLKNNVILEPLPLGSFIPSFSLSTINGDTISSKELLGKKYILLFVSPTCEHCKVVMENYKKIKKRNNIVVLAISSGIPEAVKKLEEQYDLDMISDDGEHVRKKFRIMAVPMLFFVNEEGKLVYRQAGERSFHNDSSLVADFLQNKIALQ